jgi:hypothetical protein
MIGSTISAIRNLPTADGGRCLHQEWFCQLHLESVDGSAAIPQEDSLSDFQMAQFEGFFLRPFQYPLAILARRQATSTPGIRTQLHLVSDSAVPEAVAEGVAEDHPDST